MSFADVSHSGGIAKGAGTPNTSNVYEEKNSRQTLKKPGRERYRAIHVTCQGNDESEASTSEFNVESSSDAVSF